MNTVGILPAFASASVIFAASGTLAWSEPNDREQLASSLRRQVAYCWDGQDDLGPDGQIEILVSFHLSPKGQLIGAPKVLSPEVGGTLASDAATAVERAVTAVTRCAPYDLPEDKHHMWEEVEMLFSLPKKVQLIS